MNLHEPQAQTNIKDVGRRRPKIRDNGRGRSARAPCTARSISAAYSLGDQLFQAGWVRWPVTPTAHLAFNGYLLEETIHQAFIIGRCKELRILITARQDVSFILVRSVKLGMYALAALCMSA
jgi:hypothetical protein